MHTLVLVALLLPLFVACSSGGEERAQSQPDAPVEQASTPADTVTGEPILIPSDASAQYSILERGGTPSMPTLLTRRVGPSGSSYSKRVFDCSSRTVKYLGNGDTLEELAASTPDPKMGPWWRARLRTCFGRRPAARSRAPTASSREWSNTGPVDARLSRSSEVPACGPPSLCCARRAVVPIRWSTDACCDIAVTQ